MGLGMPALVFGGGLTIAARIWSAVRLAPTPFKEPPTSPPCPAYVMACEAAVVGDYALDIASLA